MLAQEIQKQSNRQLPPGPRSTRRRSRHPLPIRCPAGPRPAPPGRSRTEPAPTEPGRSRNRSAPGNAARKKPNRTRPDRTRKKPRPVRPDCLPGQRPRPVRPDCLPGVRPGLPRFYSVDAVTVAAAAQGGPRQASTPAAAAVAAAVPAACLDRCRPPPPARQPVPETISYSKVLTRYCASRNPPSGGVRPDISLENADFLLISFSPRTRRRTRFIEGILFSASLHSQKT